LCSSFEITFCSPKRRVFSGARASANELDEARIYGIFTYSVGGLIPGLFGEDLGAAPPTVAPFGPPPDGAAVVDGYAGAVVVGGALELL
jgi:hypothetical protein